MARLLALCVLLGVIAVVSAATMQGSGNSGNMMNKQGTGSMGSMGNRGNSGNMMSKQSMGSMGNSGNSGNTGMNCPSKKYAVGSTASELFLNAPDSSGKNSGFIIDLLELMKGASGGWFDYKLTTRTDTGRKSYEGLVSDLQNKKIDIAAADLTVRSERQAVIDFLQPYLRTQIRIFVNNNPSGSPTEENGSIGENPTYYIEDDVSVTGLLQVSSNSTLNDIYSQAKANNRIVDRATGIAAVVAANGDSPTAFIGTSPGIIISNANNPNTASNSLTPDILETAYYAFGIQSNQNPLRLCLNMLQLKVQENGDLQALRNRNNLN